MPALTYVGFYAELVPDDTAPHHGSLREALSPPGDYPPEPVAAYLEAGHPVLDLTEGTRDVIGDAFHVPGGVSVLTDGTFVWRLDLAAYVRHYTPALPGPLLTRALASPAAASPLSRDALLAITGRVVADLGFRTG
ncbi:hypothetical protein SAMN06297387_12381 [Streptomyces zhaozhouensis]|uniref:Uncharacterized protein n=1 Tax=Streptomyces zhaozhouensis TaxID=1300267 RepID=A0A286E4P6_9ACTN|nr:hypothetical protein [Streptomyces zhaozhouensis]SOD65849.1 hypothetical protein SAMN06297387_12381 [Streptomyces zhaozhouensis]